MRKHKKNNSGVRRSKKTAKRKGKKFPALNTPEGYAMAKRIQLKRAKLVLDHDPRLLEMVMEKTGFTEAELKI